MIDKVTQFFVGKAYAQFGNIGNQASGNSFFNIFSLPSSATKITDPQGYFATVIGFVINWVLAIVAIIAFIYLIINGVNYITAGGDAEKATKARTGIINAIIGIIVVVIAFTILRFAVGLGTKIAQ